MPKEYGHFPNAKQMLAYLNNYARHFGLLGDIQFNSKVVLVEPFQHGSEELWQVTIQNGDTRLYKGIIVANGHHWDKRLPRQYPGTFTGTIIHSKDYKSPEILKNKRVLIVGGGNSACDIAVEAARFASASNISLRRGYWFLPRTIMGVPVDHFIKPWLPLWLQRVFIRTILRIIVGSYSQYGLEEPDHKIFEHHPTINSDLLQYIQLGKIIAHKDIKRYDGNTIEFVDDTKDDFDLIIFCTGYHVSFPMFKPGFIEFKNGVPRLLNGIFHPKHKNVYFFGVGQPRWGAGSLISIGANLALCTAIKTQQKLNHSIPDILLKLKAAKYPEKSTKSADIIVDPHQLCSDIKWAAWTIPLLPYIEPYIF